MDDTPGRELAVSEMERDPLAQSEGPLLVVGAGLPLLRQAWDVLAALGVHVEQRLHEWVVLEMFGRGDGPEAVALVEACRGEHQLLEFCVLGRSRERSRDQDR